MKCYRSICWFFSSVRSEAECCSFAYLHCCQFCAVFISLQAFQWFSDSDIISVSLLADAFLCGILSRFQQSRDLRYFLFFCGVPYYSFWITQKIPNTSWKNEGSHGTDLTSFWLKETYDFQTPNIFICLSKVYTIVCCILKAVFCRKLFCMMKCDSCILCLEWCFKKSTCCTLEICWACPSSSASKVQVNTVQ